MTRAQIRLTSAELTEIVRRHLASQGRRLISLSLRVETGDPQDPREAGYRREWAEAEVELGEPCLRCRALALGKTSPEQIALAAEALGPHTCGGEFSP